MTVFRRHPRALWRRVSDEVVMILPVELSEPTTLVGPAARLWLELVTTPGGHETSVPAPTDTDDTSLGLTIAVLVLSGAIEELDGP